MKNFCTGICLLLCVNILIFSQEKTIASKYFDIANPALKLDFTIFDLPYQIDAADAFDYGFIESYIHHSMKLSLDLSSDVYSGFHYGMKQFRDKVKMNTVWKNIIYYSSIAIGDIALYVLPMPFGLMWTHEYYHGAVFTRHNVPNIMEYNFPSGAGTSPYNNYDFKKFMSPTDATRLFEAGIESEYMLVEKMQKNNFFYNQNLFNEINYWIFNQQSWRYAFGPFLNEQSENYDSARWVYQLFHQDEHRDGVITLSDLTDNEKSYLKNTVLLSLINLASPMMFGIRTIPLGKNSGIYGNFALRQLYTSFGTDLSVNLYLKKTPFNIAFVYHNYLNYEHYFPAVEIELIDYPLSFNTWGIYLSPRIIIGVQPMDNSFTTSTPEFFGLLSCRADFIVPKLKHFLPYSELLIKTDGWLAGNEYINRTFGFALGISTRF
ncbi:hypothetical protein FACS189450_13560 [Spirochaetia bacterium]|nr:hypothetical protein FACS189450_13560 [Spirochaetia bacterium]